MSAQVIMEAVRILVQIVLEVTRAVVQVVSIFILRVDAKVSHFDDIGDT